MKFAWPKLLQKSINAVNQNHEIQAAECAIEGNSERYQRLMRLVQWAKKNGKSKLASLENRFNPSITSDAFDAELSAFIRDSFTDTEPRVIIMDFLAEYGDVDKRVYRKEALSLYLKRLDYLKLQNVIDEARNLIDKEVPVYSDDSITFTALLGRPLTNGQRIKSGISDIIFNLNELANGDERKCFVSSKIGNDFYWSSVIKNSQQNSLISAIEKIVAACKKSREKSQLFRHQVKSLSNAIIYIGPDAPFYNEVLRFFHTNSQNPDFTNEQRATICYERNEILKSHLDTAAAQQPIFREILQNAVQTQTDDALINKEIIIFLMRTARQEEWFINEVRAWAYGCMSSQTSGTSRSLDKLIMQLTYISAGLINQKDKLDPAYIDMFRIMLPGFHYLYKKLKSCRLNTDNANEARRKIFHTMQWFPVEYYNFPWFTSVLDYMLQSIDNVQHYEHEYGLEGIFQIAPISMFRLSGFSKCVKMLINQIKAQIKQGEPQFTPRDTNILSPWSQSNDAIKVIMTLLLRPDSDAVLRLIGIQPQSVEQLINIKIRHLLGNILTNSEDNVVRYVACSTLQVICLDMIETDNPAHINSAKIIGAYESNLLNNNLDNSFYTASLFAICPSNKVSGSHANSVNSQYDIVSTNISTSVKRFCF